MVLLACLLVGSCGYSAEDLDAAYRDGHRAGLIWCKREEPKGSPDLDAPLLTEWERGWSEATSVQCPGKD